MKKKMIYVGTVLMALVLSSFPCYSVETLYRLEATSIFAKPVINVTMPKSMVFVFNPFDLETKTNGYIDNGRTETKIICNYIDDENDGWIIKNDSSIPIKMGVYASAAFFSSGFSVRDANVNTVDPSDETEKFLFLDIKISGGSSGEKSITLLDAHYRTDEGEKSRRIDFKSGWWSDTNEGLITVINDIPSNGNARISMSGTTQNAGELSWNVYDKAAVHFVFGFEAEP